jgi:P4 family phage/plasmid primase-like protien
LRRPKGRNGAARMDENLWDESTPEAARAETTGKRRRPPKEPVEIPPDALQSDDHSTLAAELVKEIDGSVFADERFFRYSPAAGIWTEVPDREVGRIVQSWARRPFLSGDKVKELRVDDSDVNGTLNCTRRLLNQPGFFDDAANGITFANGFLQLDGGKARLVPHTLEQKSRHAHAFPFDPAARAPELEQFFELMMSDDAEEEAAAKIALLQEFAGACLFGLAPSYQKCLVIHAKGGQGKSQLLELFRAVFPSESSCASLPPHMWGEKFGIEALAGRLANLCDEIPESEIVAGSTFKGVVTGDPVSAERKYQPRFEFRPRAGHVFSCNALPSTADLSDGFFDRFLLLSLRKRIRGAPGAREDAARHVVASCRPGLVAWAVAGAERLAASRRYTIPASSGELLTSWRRDCDSVSIFIDERTSPSDPTRPVCKGNGHPSAGLYAIYRAWALENGFHPVTSKKFAQRVENVGVAKQRQIDGFYYAVRPKFGDGSVASVRSECV